MAYRLPIINQMCENFCGQRAEFTVCNSNGRIRGKFCDHCSVKQLELTEKAELQNHKESGTSA